MAVITASGFSFSPQMDPFSRDVLTMYGNRSYSPVMAPFSRDVFSALGRSSYSLVMPGYAREGTEYGTIYQNLVFVNPEALLAQSAVKNILPTWRKPKRTRG